MKTVLRQSALVTGAGILIGVLPRIAATVVLQSQLYPSALWNGPCLAYPEFWTARSKPLVYAFTAVDSRSVHSLAGFSYSMMPLKGFRSSSETKAPHLAVCVGAKRRCSPLDCFAEIFSEGLS